MFKQPRKSPLAVLTRVLSALDSTLRHSVSHIYRRRLTTCVSAGRAYLRWYVCGRSFVSADELASLQMQMIGRKTDGFACGLRAEVAPP